MRNLLTPLTFTDSLDFIWLYVREMLESTRKDFLACEKWAWSQHPLWRGPLWLFYREGDGDRESIWLPLNTAVVVAEQMRMQTFWFSPHPVPRLTDSKLNPSFKSSFNRKQTGRTNHCFGKVCVRSDQMLQGGNLTDGLISQMSKHVKDHEVTIKSQVSWRKLSGIKKRQNKRNEKKNHFVFLTSQRES